MLNDGDKGAVIQRDRKTYGIAPHLPCGVTTPAMLRKIADVAEKYNVGMVKVTSAQRIALLGVREEDIDAIWAELGTDYGNVTGMCVRSVKACPGTTYCKRGQQDSLDLGTQLDGRYHGMTLPGKMKIGVSGCPNQCGETNFRDIGIVGAPKGWRVYVGGNGGTMARIGQEIARELSTEELLPLVDKVVEYFRANAKPRERLGKTIERLGLAHLAAVVGVTPPEPKAAAIAQAAE